MSKKVDKNGDRTLAVVTKSDKSPEGLFEKVTADDVNIGLGYVCVRNRIGDETYKEAREEEAVLFETHPHLSKIDKSMVGISVLAQKLVHIQATIIAKCLPDIVRKVQDKLNACTSDLDRLPKTLSSPADAFTTFMGIIGASKDCLKKLLLGGEYDEYPNDKHMHCAARLREMLDGYSNDLNNSPESDPTRDFLIDEVRVLDEGKRIGLPKFLPRSAFLAILQPKVEKISHIPVEFVEKVWGYIEDVVISVFKHHSENYHQLQMGIKRACHALVEKMKEKSKNWALEMVEMERLTDYTCFPAYETEWNNLMAEKQGFLSHFRQNYSSINIVGLGTVVVKDDLRGCWSVLHEAYDLKMRMTAYWKIVMRRLVDSMALHLQLRVRNLVNKELEKEVASKLIASHDGKIEKMLEDSPAIAAKRENLNASIRLLSHSKDVLADIMDNLASMVI